MREGRRRQEGEVEGGGRVACRLCTTEAGARGPLHPRPVSVATVANQAYATPAPAINNHIQCPTVGNDNGNVSFRANGSDVSDLGGHPGPPTRRSRGRPLNAHTLA